MPLVPLLSDTILAALLLAAGMALAWSVQQRTGNSSWIDFGWTVSVASVAAALALVGASSAGFAARELAIAALIACWGLRLGLHLLSRARRGVDDPRYADLARQWGGGARRRLFWFAESQAVAGVPLVLAVLLAARRPGPFPDLQDVLGGLVVVMAIIGAGVADLQLKRFAAERAGRGEVCDRGLWRWSRHPNYFFEWLGWVGFAVLALPIHGSYAAGWLALLAPLQMYYLLVFVSGIPPLEAHMALSRPAAWAAYRARTSPFFPWPPARVRG